MKAAILWSDRSHIENEADVNSRGQAKVITEKLSQNPGQTIPDAPLPLDFSIVSWQISIII